ncbi:MAG: hypothetical protein ACXVPU_06740 [Bacteroidia bacterium]
MSKFLVAVLMTTIFVSCRFSKPIVRIPEGQYVTTDSVTSNIEKTKYFHYLNLRKGISIGNGGVVKTYNTKGLLLKKNIFKATKGALKDGNNRFYYKDISYDSLGRVSNIHCKIRQNFGRAGKVVYERTIDKTRR